MALHHTLYHVRWAELLPQTIYFGTYLFTAFRKGLDGLRL